MELIGLEARKNPCGDAWWAKASKDCCTKKSFKWIHEEWWSSSQSDSQQSNAKMRQHDFLATDCGSTLAPVEPREPRVVHKWTVPQIVRHSMFAYSPHRRSLRSWQKGSVSSPVRSVSKTHQDGGFATSKLTDVKVQRWMKLLIPSLILMQSYSAVDTCVFWCKVLDAPQRTALHHRIPPWPVPLPLPLPPAPCHWWPNNKATAKNVKSLVIWHVLLPKEVETGNKLKASAGSSSATWLWTPRLLQKLSKNFSTNICSLYFSL